MACSASAPPRCWRRCASGTSDASGSRTWCRCSATGPAGSRWRCWCSSAPARRPGRPRSRPCRWPASWASARCSPPSPTATGASRVMLVADVARAGALRRHAPPDPGRRAARAGVPRRPRHPAVRGGSLRGPARPRPRGPLRRGARARRGVGAVVARHRLRARWACCSTVVDAEVALAINSSSFLVSAMLLLGLRHTAAAEPAGVPSTVGQSLGDGAASLFRDRLVRRALVIVAVTGALGTVGEALVVPYAVEVGLPDGALGLLAAAVPVGTLIAHRGDRQRHPRPPSPAPQRRLVRRRHRGRGRAAVLARGERRPRVRRLRRSPAACSPCRSPPTP